LLFNRNEERTTRTAAPSAVARLDKDFVSLAGDAHAECRRNRLICGTGANMLVDRCDSDIELWQFDRMIATFVHKQ
jgi:hypothetical protein